MNYFDYFCFHCPYAKMVEKSFYQLIGYDITKNKSQSKVLENNYYDLTNLSISNIFKSFSNRSRNYKFEAQLQEDIKRSFNQLFAKRVDPSLTISKNLGNIYTGSLYSLLIGIILSKNKDLLVRSLI